MTVKGEATSICEGQDLIKEVRRDREDLARVLKKHAGIRKIVEDLYPDSAHFIYELLQNAEDTGATEAVFILSGNALTFEHNGRPFEEKDIYGITDIGEGTKSTEDDKIGRFGVGFKAVFAYTETPHIWSPTYCFKIEDLVLPSAITPRRDIGKRTRFEFPFNNPKKSADAAQRDVIEGLRGLAETALLFLSHLQCIGWRTSTGESGQIMRIQHADHHIEVLKESGNRTSSLHFLKFDEPVPGLEKQRVAVAFALDLLPNVKRFNAAAQLARQFRITETRGSVAVYFPAEKESSGLRFHLHAPFVPELSRASIKETDANKPLLEQLAELSAFSLRQIREYGLLTPEFLAVLPNKHDQISSRYDAIRERIILAMNTEPLTPTHDKSHAPARDLLQAKATLKDLLSAGDIEYLVDYDENPPRWAVGVTQKNTKLDHFLASLAIKDWGIEEFTRRLIEKTSEPGAHWNSHFHFYNNSSGPEQEFMAWLATKPTEWHQQLYALLYGEFEPERRLHGLKGCRIVRLSNGDYGLGGQCFFPDDGDKDDKVLPRVAVSVFTSGKSKTQQDNAKKLLEQIGVRVVGEAEHVEVVLKKRYAGGAGVPDERTYVKDLKRFIALVEKEPQCAKVFQNFYIFECEDDQWRKPSQVFLDKPFLDTGLGAFYGAQSADATLFPLSDKLQECGIAPKRIGAFAAAAGAKTELVPIRRRTAHHPSASDLRIDYSQAGVRWTSSAIDEDWTIPGLDDALKKNSERLSLLIWNTLSQLSEEFLQAQFRPNQRYAVRVAPSTLVLQLRAAPWVPQGNGLFVRPSQASRDLLPNGFAFDQGQRWLRAVQWGEAAEQHSEQQRQKEVIAKELGFADEGSLERAQRFAALSLEDQERVLASVSRRANAELPDHEPSNPTRRAEKVAAEAATAPARETEERERSVSLGREPVKERAAQYLSQQYTSDGHVICQVCKKPMPFKLDDGSDYFERVEFLPELKKRHYQNYLALCPNHAAMFKVANGSTERLLDSFAELSSNELEVVLAQEETTIYFTRTHIADLKQVIQTDQASAATADRAPLSSTAEKRL